MTAYLSAQETLCHILPGLPLEGNPWGIRVTWGHHSEDCFRGLPDDL